MEQGFLSENLKYLRKINNLNQDDFAKELGLKRSTYAYQEKMGFSGKSFIILSELVSIKFGYTLDFLIKNDLRANKEPTRQTNHTKIITAIEIIEKQLAEIKKQLK